MQGRKWNGRNLFETKKPRYWVFFLTSFLGVLVGALITLVFLSGVIGKQDASAEDESFATGDKQYVEKIDLTVKTAFTEAVEKAKDAVVGISNYANGSIWEQIQEIATGSGVIYKKAGDRAFVVTNYHVVEGADLLEVILADGTKLEAELVGGDIWTDLAVLTIPAQTIHKVADFGDSDLLKLGEPVLAIGNPLGKEFAGSVTQGIISGLERTVPVDIDQNGTIDWNAEVLQTDAAINPGNSGGALVNSAGELIGINSMKIAQQEVEGIGFAIPINTAIPIIEDLERYGEVTRPYMGVYLSEVTNVSRYHRQYTLMLPQNIDAGVLISRIEPGGPADLAGLKEMDIIVSLDGRDIQSIIELRKYLYKEKEIGETLRVGYFREGAYDETVLTLTKAR